METMYLILDGDVSTLVDVLTLSSAIWTSGCVGYAAGVWRTENRPVTESDLRPVFVNGEWYLPRIGETTPINQIQDEIGSEPKPETELKRNRRRRHRAWSVMLRTLRLRGDTTL